MHLRSWPYLCSLALVAVLSTASAGTVQAAAGPAGAPASAPSQKTLLVDGLGKGTVDLGGLWQFHTGDDPAWASPRLDDSGWESILADSSWGAQGHPSYTGFGWYRRHLNIRPASAMYQYEILVPMVEDAYEVYWNGRLIGGSGQFPPHARWYYSNIARTFPLRGENRGVLAIRVWKAPLDIFSPAESGGMLAPPTVGDPDTIALNQQAITWNYVRQDLFDYALILLRLFIAALCVILFTRNREEPLFLWVGVFTVTPVALGVLQNLFFIPFTYQVARFINQPVYALANISLWFLLLWLLELNDNRRVARLTRTLAWVAMAAGVLDGVLALSWGGATLWMQWADGLLAALILLTEFFPFVLIAIGLRRRRLDASRWAVAIAALLSQLIQTFGDASALGWRFTRWTLYDKLIDNQSIQIQGVVFGPQKVTSLALFAAILYAVYRYILSQQARRAVLEQEMQSAREIQQVLIPDSLPSMAGFAITSAYHPAQEVGGDFFQILAKPNGSLIVALGDVSGKGLKAAMNVSMIVGALRAESASSDSPSQILNGLNRCLVGRMHGGFATGIVFRLDSDGTVTFSNAGHLPPFLNGQEFPLDPSLPLGLLVLDAYTDLPLHLNPGDQLSLYTDGLLEARNETGELYGFARMQALFAGRPTAQQASEAAVAFGQDDDITVLTLARLADGETPTTLVTSALDAAEAEA